MIRNIALLFMLLFCSGLQAHQDRIIQVMENGNLDGLPKQYQPASINTKSATISIAQNTIVLPPCLSKYFAFNDIYTLQVTSSWYHERSSLPPYINFKIQPKNKDHAYSILFGLDDLSVIEAQVITYPNKGTTAFHTIAFDKHCQKDINGAYVKK